MDDLDYTNNPLWPILVEVVRELPLYPNHKNYISELLEGEPALSAKEVSVRLRIPFGEALVILKEMEYEKDGCKNPRKRGVGKL